MSPSRSICFYCVMIFTFITSYSYAQPDLTLFNLNKWSDKLSSEKEIGYSSTLELLHLVSLQDSINVFSTISQLETKVPDANMFYKARVNCFLALARYQYKTYRNNAELIAITEQAITEAYETKDKRFIAFINWICGSLMITMQHLELAATYNLRAEDIYSKIGYTDYDPIKMWCVIGEMLFHTKNYNESISYTKRALNNWNDTTNAGDLLRTRHYNTIGQDYEQLNKFDSALIYLDTALMIAEKSHREDWKGINSGFMGEVLFKMKQYEKARPLLELDYNTNKDANIDIAAKSLQWLARINLVEGKNDSALYKSRQAVRLMDKIKFKYYLQPSHVLEMCYSALAESFKAKGELDSFYHYNQLYSQLHDSLELIARQSSSSIIQMKLDNENILSAIQQLQKEKRNEVITRNLTIGAIILLMVTVVLYVKHYKLKQQHKEELVLQEKKIAETELVSAKQQMHQFTENIVEKSDLIEQLQQKIANTEINPETRQTIAELSKHTILTEADWDNFKKMFEKIYPLFFTSLKEKAPNITVAEQRMAALIRLNLNSKQMASILGISVDSVHKSKQRLRQRLQVQDGTNLEETLSYI
jgi:hypothetical protein